MTEWSELAQEGSIEKLTGRMLGGDLRSISMRQTTPFNGVLTPEERIDAIYRARASFEQGYAMTREVSAGRMRGLQQQARDELEAKADGQDTYRHRVTG